MSSKRQSHLPPQTETLAWARMLAAARGADVIHAGGVLTATTDPLTMKRLGTLFPVAKDLYETKARPEAATQSREIANVIVHCQEFVNCQEFIGTMESLYRQLGISHEQHVKPWAQKSCESAARLLFVPLTLKALRPAPPDVIGLFIFPQSPVWRMVRNAVMSDLSQEDMGFYKAYYQGMIDAKRARKVNNGAVPPRLHNVRFVDEVRARAPPLIGVLPSRWTAARSTDKLLEAMLALLQLPGTRPLAALVDKLAESEYDLLVAEHSCLSQILDSVQRKESCAKGRNVGEYVAFADFLRQDDKFKGSLADVPPKKATNVRPPAPRSRKRPNSAGIAASDLNQPDANGAVAMVGDRLEIKVPAPSNTAEWARMLAAARGADFIHASGVKAIIAAPLTMKRLGTLFPVADDLYETAARQDAIAESKKLDSIMAHCQEFIGTIESLKRELNITYSQSMQPWDKQRCESEATTLLVPLTLKALRPAPPDAIGLCMVPQSPVWYMVRDARMSNLTSVDMSLYYAYSHGIRQLNVDTKADGSVWQRLRIVQFVDEVHVRAPPLIAILPTRWTAADGTDELHEAMLALLQVPGTRPLDVLVDKLSETEYGLLVAEQSCLSQILVNVQWNENCADGRNVDEYVAFADFLRQDEKFTDSLADVPAKRQKRSRKKPIRQKASHSRTRTETYPEKSTFTTSRPPSAPRGLNRPSVAAIAASDSTQPDGNGMVAMRDVPSRRFDDERYNRNQFYLTTIVNRPVIQVPPQLDTAAWARMLAAARGADVIHAGGVLKTTTDPLTMKRLGTLFPVADDLYETAARQDAIAESNKLDNIMVHCQKFIGTIESLKRELNITFALPEEPWDKQSCESEASTLLVPIKLRSLRPAPPDVIGLCMVPKSPVWNMVRTAIMKHMSQVDWSLYTAYSQAKRYTLLHQSADPSAWPQLDNVRFVDEVHTRAPALIGVLPPRWTAAGFTDELLEAMQALLQVPGTRPLDVLVDKLSDSEYDLLVKERSCLSPILDKVQWNESCAEGRNVGDYVSFVDFLRQYESFTGSLANVPQRRQKRRRTGQKVETWSSSEALSEDVESSAITCTTTSESEVLDDDFNGALANVPQKRQNPKRTCRRVKTPRTSSAVTSPATSESEDSHRGTSRKDTALGPSKSLPSSKRRRIQKGARQRTSSKTSASYDRLEQFAQLVERAAADSCGDSDVNSKILPVPGAVPVTTHAVFNPQRAADDGESPAPKEWEDDWELIDVNDLPDLDERRDPDLGANGDDVEMIDDCGHGLAAIDPKNWLQAIPQFPIERGPIVGLPLLGREWQDLQVFDQARGAASDPAATDTSHAHGTAARLQPQQRELRSVEFPAPGDGARVVPLAVAGAVTALGLMVVLVALAFRMRARRTSGGFSRSRATSAGQR